MITEAMVTKGFAYIGAWVVSTKVVAPVLGVVGTALGHGLGMAVNAVTGSKRKTYKERVETDQEKEKAILALISECSKENLQIKQEAAEEEPKSQFDQKTQDWIRKCQEQYGGFSGVILE